MTGHPLDNAISDAASVDPVQKLVAEAAVQLASQQVVNDISFRLDELESTVRDVVPAYGTDGGGVGDKIVYPQYPSVFEIVEDSETCGVSTYRFDNQYFEVSGVLYDLKSDYTFTRHYVENLYLAIVLSSVSTPQAYIQEYHTFEDMQTAMADETKSVIPLYKFDSEGAVACDLRHIPRADMWTLGGIELPSGGAAS